MAEQHGHTQQQQVPSISAGSVQMMPQSPKQSSIARSVLVLLICATVGFAGGVVGSSSQDRLATDTNQINRADQERARSESQLISAIAKKASPSVVSVNVTSRVRSGFGVSSQQSAGTGIILSSDGYIVTNRHVIPSGTQQVTVTLSDGTELERVEVVGRTGSSDPLDIAFLKVNDTEGVTLTAAALGDSSQVQVGDKVVAIGNALGQFQNTVTDGIISGYGRDIQAGDQSGGNVETLQNLFQTDAAINQGNSGGPLLNIEGEVIGINTAVAGDGAQGIGFAIPINDVKGLINSVLREGKLIRPYLGVRYITLTDDYAAEYDLPVKRGAYILPSNSGQASIIPGSPADKAGVREEDIITKVDGTAIDDRNNLTSLIGQKSVGDTVSLTIVREGKETSVDVTLQAAPTD
jgi:serine protease Do